MEVHGGSVFQELPMSARPSLTAQLKWAVVQAEKRVQSAATVDAALRHAAAGTRQADVDQDTEVSCGENGLPPAASVSYPSSLATSGSVLSSSASPDSNLQHEGWDAEVSCLARDACCGVTSALLHREGGAYEGGTYGTYLQELLSDEGDDDIQMLDDLLAYQIIHSELQDMIANVSSLESSSCACGPPAEVRASPRDPEVEAWMASMSTAVSPPAAGAPPRPPPATQECEESSQASDSQPAVPPREGEEEQEKSLEDVTAMLVECAQAVVTDDYQTATTLICRIREYATPDGSQLQRLAHYFVEALMAKLNGTGADLYTAVMKRDKQAVLEAEKVYMSKDPTPAVAHHFGKNVLLQAFSGAQRVHIIDYGILGHQWQGLIQALAYRPEGPPRLRITGIELPQPGSHPDGMVKETGRKLHRLAASLGITLEFRCFACKWEDVHVSQLCLRDDEVLAVSSLFRLRHLLDDSVVLSNPRRTVLERICSMNPKVFLMADRSVAANAPFLLPRLKESIPGWYSFFDFLDTILPRDSDTRRLVEQENFGYRILNTIACEGMDRRERPEAYHQWHRRLVNAGFEPSPLAQDSLSSVRELLQDYHSGWTAGQDLEWILTGWKGRIHHAYSAWRPRPS